MQDDFGEAKPMEYRLKNSTAITVRLKKRDDGDALGKMLAACSDQTYYFFHPYPLTYDSGLKVVEDETITCFVAFADAGDAVGYVWMDNADTPTVGICSRDGWQGIGVGRILLRQLIREAQTHGKKALQLTVMKDNSRAIALYQSVGFVIDGDASDPMGPSYHMTLHLKTGVREEAGVRD